MDLSAYSVRTDLALEAHDLAAPAGQTIPGVHMSAQELDGIRISTVDITSEEGSRAIGKLPGHYITLEVPELRKKDSALQDRVATVLPRNLKLSCKN